MIHRLLAALIFIIFGLTSVSAEHPYLVESVQGQHVNLSANMIGGAALDPVLHKVMHGVLGGGTGYLLNGLEGMKAGAASAVIAETLADVMKPSALEAAKEIDALSESKEVFDTHIDAYLSHQKDLMMLMTAGITAGLGQDVDTAITVADNALTHNNLTVIKLALQSAWTGVKAAVQFGKGVVKEGVKKEVKKLAKDVAKELGGVKAAAKGDGYKVVIPNGNNPITVRIMEKAGQRTEPYYRISLDKGGSITKIGKFSNDPLQTHMEINGNSLVDIISAINKIKG